MPIPEALTLISASVTLAKNLYLVTLGLYEWLDRVKNIDKTIKDLADEVTAFRETLQTVERCLSSQVVQQAACLEDDEDALQLWCSLCDTLKECKTTTTQLGRVIIPMSKSDDNAVLRKVKLDFKANDIQGIKDQISMHNKRLALAVQMVQLRVSCATPGLITSNITSQIGALRALMTSQIEMIAELTRNPSTSNNVTADVINGYAVSIGKTAQSLISSADSIYKGSDWGGSVKADDPEIHPVSEWLDDVVLSDFEVRSNSTDIWTTSGNGNTVSTAFTSTEDETKDPIFGDSKWRSVKLPNDPEKAMEQQQIEQYLQAKGIANIHSLDFNASLALEKIVTWHVQRKTSPTHEMNLAIKLLFDIDMKSSISPDAVEKGVFFTNITLLLTACWLGWYETCDVLLHAGASPDDFVRIAKYSTQGYHTGATMYACGLQLAVRQGHTRIVHRLLKTGAALGPRGLSSESALHHAANKGYAEIVQALLDANADVDEGPYGSTTHVGLSAYIFATALHSACFNAQTLIARILVDRGANLEIKNTRGDTPIQMLAIEAVKHVQMLSKSPQRISKYKDILDILSAAGAVINKATAKKIEQFNRICELSNEPSESARSSIWKRLIEKRTTSTSGEEYS